MATRDVLLPSAFCWTRFGTEAGEPIGRILERKEAERVDSDGVFLWGIGSSVGPGVAALLEGTEPPEVLFSPIKGRPRREDVSPECVVEWARGETLDGEVVDLPSGAHVTSRYDNARPRPHYALVCKSAAPLAAANFGSLDFVGLRNLVSGKRLGASQVTAVVKRIDTPSDSRRGTPYTVALRAALAPPYFVRLRDPLVVRGGAVDRQGGFAQAVGSVVRPAGGRVTGRAAVA